MNSVSTSRGFTIFELLVVMAIIAIMAVLTLARFREGQASYEVAQAAQLFVSDVRQAQGMAISGAETAGQGGGYGIRSGLNSYILFLNDSNDNDGCPNGSEIIVKTIYLPSGVSLSPGSGEIFFAPPDARTCIGGNKNTEEAQFVFIKGSNQKPVTMTKHGQVEVQ